jgi:IclR family pca regulon transcriptional regulator
MDNVQDKKIDVDNPGFINSLAGCFDVLLAFDTTHSAMTLSEVAERTKMDRAKARRYLLTLHALGYVDKDNRQFSLSPKILSLGASYLNSSHHNTVQYYLEQVTEKTGESCSFGVRDGDDIVYVARSASEIHLMSITLSIGTRMPIAYTSMGRIILADLPKEQLKQYIKNVELTAYTANSITDRRQFYKMLQEVKEKGYVIIDQELDIGLRALAIPVYKSNNELLGSISIGINAMRISHDVLIKHFLPILRDCADKIQAYYI